MVQYAILSTGIGLLKGEGEAGGGEGNIPDGLPPGSSSVGSVYVARYAHDDDQEQDESKQSMWGIVRS